MSSDALTNFKQILSRNDYRVTKARIGTFRLLISPEPQTISEILRKSDGKLDRVSIYRNIEVFERLGIVRRIYVGWKYKLELSDQFVDHHHHLICLGCGKVIDIQDEQHIDHFIDEMAKKFNFEPLQHQFEVEGWCASCRAKLQHASGESSALL